MQGTKTVSWFESPKKKKPERRWRCCGPAPFRSGLGRFQCMGGKRYHFFTNQNSGPNWVLVLYSLYIYIHRNKMLYLTYISILIM